MTRKHFELIAKVMEDVRPNRSVHDNHAYDTWLDGVNSLSEAFQKENPRFDKERFLSACGVTT